MIIEFEITTVTTSSHNGTSDFWVEIPRYAPPIAWADDATTYGINVARGVKLIWESATTVGLRKDSAEKIDDYDVNGKYVALHRRQVGGANKHLRLFYETRTERSNIE